MFRTVRCIIDWCGDCKKKLYIGFVFSFFSRWAAAMPVMVAAWTISMLASRQMYGTAFDSRWVWYSFFIILGLVALRFVFDYIRARLQEPISYTLVARDRLAIGDALKRVSLGYFQKKNTGDILSSITTGLNTLEMMGIRMTDTFISGYLDFICVLLFIVFVKPVIALIAVAAALVSLGFLILISFYSSKNSPAESESNRELTGATLEYARGLGVVKSFAQGGASVSSMKNSIEKSRRTYLKIEWGFIPNNCLHIFALDAGTVAIGLSSVLMYINGSLSFMYMLMFIFFSFIIFASLIPVSDSAHILGTIDDAFDNLDALKESSFIDRDGRDISLSNFDIDFSHVNFGYDSRQVLKDVSFSIPEKTSTAIVGPSGSGKSTICSLISRFYDVDSGAVFVGNTDIRKMTCDSLLKNISMVFQNVYLFNDTIRANILFGNPDATEEEMIEASKKACCYDFIMKLKDGFDTVVGEGGNLLSGGEKQRVSIARAILKDSPIIILDEATASVDPENEHLIQDAITELTRGRTVITIAHRLRTIENADQILVIQDGQVAERGRHEELVLQDGLYRRFVGIREQSENWSL